MRVVSLSFAARVAAYLEPDAVVDHHALPIALPVSWDRARVDEEVLALQQAVLGKCSAMELLCNVNGVVIAHAEASPCNVTRGVLI